MHNRASCSYLLPNVEDSHVKPVHWQDDSVTMWLLQHPATTPCTTWIVTLWGCGLQRGAAWIRKGLSSADLIPGVLTSQPCKLLKLPSGCIPKHVYRFNKLCLKNIFLHLPPPMQSMDFMTQDGAGCMLSISVRKSINLAKQSWSDIQIPERLKEIRHKWFICIAKLWIASTCAYHLNPFQYLRKRHGTNIQNQILYNCSTLYLL